MVHLPPQNSDLLQCSDPLGAGKSIVERVDTIGESQIQSNICSAIFDLPVLDSGVAQDYSSLLSI